MSFHTFNDWVVQIMSIPLKRFQLILFSDKSLVYCDFGEVAWLTSDDVLMVLNRGIDSCLQNTKITPERRVFNFKQMRAIKDAGEHNFTDWLNPKKLSIGQSEYLYITLLVYHSL